MTLKPPIIPVEGTVFHASIGIRPNGEWRASCYVRERSGANQATQTRVFETEDEARDWIASIGIARGFKSMIWD